MPGKKQSTHSVINTVSDEIEKFIQCLNKKGPNNPAGKKRKLTALENHWQEHPLVKSWFQGQRINWGTEKNPDWRQISNDEVIKTLKLCLQTFSEPIVEFFCKDNAHLLAALNQLDLEVEKNFLLKMMNINSHRKSLFLYHFLSSLKNRPSLIECMQSQVEEDLANSPSYSHEGKKVLLALIAEDKPYPRRTDRPVSPPCLPPTNNPIEDGINQFLASLYGDKKRNLLPQKLQTVQAICNTNPAVMNWFHGERINFSSDATTPDWRQISHEALLDAFKLCIATHYEPIAALFCQDNLLLIEALNQLNLDDEKELLLDFINVGKGKSLFLYNFLSSLNNQALIEAMQVQLEASSNPYKKKCELLDLVLTKKPYPTKKKPLPLAASPTLAAIQRFKDRATSVRQKTDICNLWNINPVIQRWVLGEAIDVGTVEAPDVCIISADERYKLFIDLIKGQQNHIVAAFWKISEALRTTIKEKQLQDDGEAALLFIKILVASKCARPLKITILEACRRSLVEQVLQSLLQSEENSQNKSQIKTLRLFLIDQTTVQFPDFMKAIKTRGNAIALWNTDPAIKDWYFGTPTNIEKNGQIIQETVSSQELIATFKTVLSHDRSMLYTLFYDKNPLLRQAIDQLTHEEKKELTLVVFATRGEGNSPFIRQFLIDLQDDELLEEIKSEIAEKFALQPTPYQKGQLIALEKYKFERALQANSLMGNRPSNNRSERSLANAVQNPQITPSPAVSSSNASPGPVSSTDSSTWQTAVIEKPNHSRPSDGGYPRYNLRKRPSIDSTATIPNKTLRTSTRTTAATVQPRVCAPNSTPDPDNDRKAFLFDAMEDDVLAFTGKEEEEAINNDFPEITFPLENHCDLSPASVCHESRDIQGSYETSSSSFYNIPSSPLFFQHSPKPMTTAEPVITQAPQQPTKIGYSVLTELIAKPGSSTYSLENDDDDLLSQREWENIFWSPT